MVVNKNTSTQKIVSSTPANNITVVSGKTVINVNVVGYAARIPSTYVTGQLSTREGNFNND